MLSKKMIEELREMTEKERELVLDNLPTARREWERAEYYRKNDNKILGEQK